MLNITTTKVQVTNLKMLNITSMKLLVVWMIGAFGNSKWIKLVGREGRKGREGRGRLYYTCMCVRAHVVILHMHVCARARARVCV